MIFEDCHFLFDYYNEIFKISTWLQMKIKHVQVLQGAIFQGQLPRRNFGRATPMFQENRAPCYFRSQKNFQINLNIFFHNCKLQFILNILISHACILGSYIKCKKTI